MDHNITTNDTLKDTLKDTRSEVHSKLDRAVSSAHSGVDKIADRLDSVGERFSARTSQVTGAYKRLSENGRDYARRHPATTVLVALAAGYAVSKLLGSRKH